MRGVSLTIGLLAVLLVAGVGPTQAKGYAVDTTVAFVNPSNGKNTDLTFLAGAYTGSTPATKDAYVFQNTTGFTIEHVKQVWASSTSKLYDKAASGSYTIRVNPSGLIAFDPAASTATASKASYALGVPIDIQQTIGTLHYGKSMLALGVGLNVTFPTTLGVSLVTAAQLQGVTAQNVPGAKIFLLSATSSLIVMDGATTVTTIKGGSSKDLNGVAMSGDLVVKPFGAGAALLPFAAGATATFEAAKGKALTTASKELSFDQLSNTLKQLQGGDGSGGSGSGSGTGSGSAGPGSGSGSGSGSNGGSGSGSGTNGGSNGGSSGKSLGGGDSPLGALQPILIDLLNGGFLRVATKGDKPDLQNMTIARGGAFQVTSNGNTMQAQGNGPLIVQNGQVVGAGHLIVVFGYFAMPWWSLLLWVAGIVLWILCLVLKKSKKNETWDKYRWIGRVATLVVTILVLWLWDRYVQHVVGVSALSGGLEGSTRLVVALVEYMLFGVITFFVAAPMRLLLRSGFRLANQGTFMGMASPIAVLLTWLIGFGLLLDYFGFLLSRMSGLLT